MNPMMLVVLWLVTGFSKLFLWFTVVFIPVGVAYYFYLKHRASYFSNLGLPQPPITSLFLGNLEEFEKNGKNHEKLQEWEQIYGSTFGMQQGGHHVIVTSDLELLQEIFIKQFHVFQSRQLHPSFAQDQWHGKSLNLFSCQGRQWKRLRALFASSLTTQKVKSADPIIRGAVEELIGVLKKHQGDVIDVAQHTFDYTFAVISRAAIGVHYKFGENHFKDTFVRGMNRQETIKNPFKALVCGTVDFLPITKNFAYVYANTYLYPFKELDLKINKVLCEREVENQEQKSSKFLDFMHFLKVSMDNTIDTTNSAILDSRVTKKLTRVELIGQGQAFFVGGADTAASLLNYCLYELARHPNFERIVVNEIEELFQHEDIINYDTVKSLEFLDRFIKEVSRVHPFAYTAATRRAIHPTTITDSSGKKLKIDKGICIQPNPFAIAFDKAIWGPDAKTFNPDRFLPENSKTHHPMAMLLFGAGLRTCPGKHLAIHEVKVALTYLLKEFKFEICDDTEVNEVTRFFLTIEALKMKIFPRKK